MMRCLETKYLEKQQPFISMPLCPIALFYFLTGMYRNLKLFPFYLSLSLSGTFGFTSTWDKLREKREPINLVHHHMPSVPNSDLRLGNAQEAFVEWMSEQNTGRSRCVVWEEKGDRRAVFNIRRAVSKREVTFPFFSRRDNTGPNGGHFKKEDLGSQLGSIF